MNPCVISRLIAEPPPAVVAPDSLYCPLSSAPPERSAPLPVCNHLGFVPRRPGHRGTAAQASRLDRPNVRPSALSSAQVWDLRNSISPAREFHSHKKGVLAMAWSSLEPSLLLTCGKDNRTLCWDTGSGEVVAELPASSNWCGRTHPFRSVNQSCGSHWRLSFLVPRLRRALCGCDS